MAILIRLLVQRRTNPLRTKRYLYRKSQDGCRKFGQPGDRNSRGKIESAATSRGRPATLTGRSISDWGRAGRLSPTMTVTAGGVSFFAGEQAPAPATATNRKKRKGKETRIRAKLLFSSFQVRHFSVINYVEQPAGKKVVVGHLPEHHPAKPLAQRILRLQADG